MPRLSPWPFLRRFPQMTLTVVMTIVFIVVGFFNPDAFSGLQEDPLFDE